MNLESEQRQYDSDGIGIGVICFPCDPDGADAGHIALVMTGAPLYEYKNILVPGVRFTPDQARSIAQMLLETADEAEGQ